MALDSLRIFQTLIFLSAKYNHFFSRTFVVSNRLPNNYQELDCQLFMLIKIVSVLELILYFTSFLLQIGFMSLNALSLSLEAFSNQKVIAPNTFLNIHSRASKSVKRRLNPRRLIRSQEKRSKETDFCLKFGLLATYISLSKYQPRAQLNKGIMLSYISMLRLTSFMLIGNQPVNSSSRISRQNLMKTGWSCQELWQSEIFNLIFLFSISINNNNKFRMGSCQFTSNDQSDQFKEVIIQKQHFVTHYCIGKGGFGKVWKVQMKKTNQWFAMKEMAKARILNKRSVESVMNERKILSEVNCDFIVNIENLYLLMDLLSGGDLRFHLNHHRHFTEEQTKFFVACILLGFEYIHERKIIHRDIKPENIVLDQDGYLRITDFGIARYAKRDNAKETSGTPSYMAPEVLCKQNHNQAVDYYALGVIAHECMMGKRPYAGKQRNEIKEQVLQRQADIKESEVPKGWSKEAAVFINKLLIRKQYRRMGQYGVKEAKCDPWLKDFDWQGLKDRTIVPSFKPPNADNFSQRVVSEGFKDENDERFKEHTNSLDRQGVQKMFENYYYNYMSSMYQKENTLINVVEKPAKLGQQNTQQIDSKKTEHILNTRKSKTFLEQDGQQALHKKLTIAYDKNGPTSKDGSNNDGGQTIKRKKSRRNDSQIQEED